MSVLEKLIKKQQRKKKARVVSYSSRICNYHGCELSDKEQSIDNFYINHVTGYINPTCKACISKKQKERYRDDEEYRTNKLEYFSKWRKDNINHVTEQGKIYRQQNADEVKRYNKSYYTNNKDNIAKHRKHRYRSLRENMRTKNKSIPKTFGILPLQLEIINFLAKFMGKKTNKFVREALDHVIQLAQAKSESQENR